MKPVFLVEVTLRASIQIERAAVWWAENRPAAPEAVRIDFQEALLLLERQPGVGARAKSSRYADLRRIHLSRIRYHLYYRVSGSKVIILALWHSSRGSGPVL